MGKVYTRESMVEQRMIWKQKQKKVVFTNGVFDILHRGHIEYLSQAKSLGDVLVVGLNSDASVKRIKGELRPIVCEEDRAFILSQLVSVDAVCLFEEDTPLKIISALVPDILVKGADYTVDAIIGKEIVERSGGSVQTIEFVPNRSTSDIVKTIVSRFSNIK